MKTSDAWERLKNFLLPQVKQVKWKTINKVMRKYFVNSKRLLNEKLWKMQVKKSQDAAKSSRYKKFIKLTFSISKNHKLFN
jgi:hypothetical protein